jgi:hypothetical protein
MRRPVDWLVVVAIAASQLVLAAAWAYSLDCVRVAPGWVTTANFALASGVLVGWSAALIHALRRE